MGKARAGGSSPSLWLLLIHAIPPQPAYFRAKVGRRLARVGAVALKNSVYVLPAREQPREDFQWIAREILDEGGEATVCEASFVEGLRNDHVEALFRAARQADYAELGEEARAALRALGPRTKKRGVPAFDARAELARLRKRLVDVLAIDFFGAQGREPAEAAIAALEARLDEAPRAAAAPGKPARADYQGRTWVTRKNVHVDRIASAWLIRRFIDPKAKFRFVASSGPRVDDGEVSFDMVDGTFTHVGDRCTFEVLVDAFALKDPGLRPLAEIVHDIDVKDSKFARGEAHGFAALIAAIALTRRDDDARIAFGGEVLDALLELYRRRRGAPEEP
jgi:hypothetical protein